MLPPEGVKKGMCSGHGIKKAFFVIFDTLFPGGFGGWLSRALF
jgi:hypothetical protein